MSLNVRLPRLQLQRVESCGAEGPTWADLSAALWWRMLFHWRLSYYYCYLKNTERKMSVTSHSSKLFVPAKQYCWDIVCSSRNKVHRCSITKCYLILPVAMDQQVENSFRKWHLKAKEDLFIWFHSEFSLPSATLETIKGLPTTTLVTNISKKILEAKGWGSICCKSSFPKD